MSGSLAWFIGVSLSLPLMWWAGYCLGKSGDTTRRFMAIGLAIAAMLLWGWLVRHPAVAVHVMPISALARVEGIGATPLFIFIVGVAWSAAALNRQRAFVIVGLFMGAGYFLQGGWWMLQQTPAGAFAQGRGEITSLQSQDYSCVPAACSTALRVLSVDTSESEMANLTETRPGTGATLIRALNGLSIRLEHEGITPLLIEPDFEALLALSPPMLTPLQYEATRLHMVTILRVEQNGVLVMDPVAGMEMIHREEFERIYRGQVIVFERH